MTAEEREWTRGYTEGVADQQRSPRSTELMLDLMLEIALCIPFLPEDRAANLSNAAEAVAERLVPGALAAVADLSELDDDPDQPV